MFTDFNVISCAYTYSAGYIIMRAFQHLCILEYLFFFSFSFSPRLSFALSFYPSRSSPFSFPSLCSLLSSTRLSSFEPRQAGWQLVLNYETSLDTVTRDPEREGGPRGACLKTHRSVHARQYRRVSDSCNRSNVPKCMHFSIDSADRSRVID